jgi:hypothetical protein
MDSVIWIPQVVDYSCAQHSQATSRLTSEEPESIMPLPQTLICREHLSVAVCRREPLGQLMKRGKLCTDRHFAPKYGSNGESCELYGSFQARSCLSVRAHGTTRLPLDGISWNLTLDYFFKILSRKFEFHQNLTIIKGKLHKDQNTFLIKSKSVLLKMRNVSDKSCRENQNTNLMFNNTFSKIIPFMRYQSFLFTK